MGFGGRNPPAAEGGKILELNNLPLDKEVFYVEEGGGLFSDPVYLNPNKPPHSVWVFGEYFDFRSL